MDGERACDALAAKGLVAACNMNGSGEAIDPAYVEQLRGFKRVTVVKDNDDAGERHGEKWAWALHGVVPEVRTLRFKDMPPKSGADDWLAVEGNTVEQLVALANEAPLWTPTAEADSDSDRKPRPIHHCTDVGNALRLVDRHGDDLRHVAEWGLLVWDGRRWGRDLTREMMRRARETTRHIYYEAKHEPIASRRKKLATWATTSESRTRLEAMIELGKSDARIQARPEDFDRDPMLLNVANGTIDLKSGILCPHRREDLITKLTPIKFDPDAKAPRWEKFLEEITARPGGDGKPNEELVGFLQRAVGYSSTGHVKERVVINCWGSGKNGKSVFLRTLAEAFGEYAHQAEPQLLLARRKRRRPPERNRPARRTRYVIAIKDDLVEAIAKRGALDAAESGGW